MHIASLLIFTTVSIKSSPSTEEYIWCPWTKYVMILSHTVASPSRTWLFFRAWLELGVKTALTATKNEEDRQVVHHRMLHELFEERLFFPIITYPRRVLDCGYGRGQWAVALAQCYDQAEVSKSHHASVSMLSVVPASGRATGSVELLFNDLRAS